MENFEKLCDAIRQEDLNQVKELVEVEKVDLNFHDSLALKIASSQGAKEILCYLVEKGANVLAHNGVWLDNIIGFDNLTLDELKFLWEHGARGQNPLIACEKDNLIFKFLVEHIHESHFKDEWWFIDSLNQKEYLLIKKLNYDAIFSTLELKQKMEKKFETLPYVLNSNLIENLKNNNYEELGKFHNFEDLKLEDLKKLNDLAHDYLSLRFKNMNLFILLSKFKIENLQYVIKNINDDFTENHTHNMWLSDLRLQTINSNPANLNYLIKHAKINDFILSNLFEKSLNSNLLNISEAIIKNSTQNLDTLAFLSHQINPNYLIQIRFKTNPSQKELDMLDACINGDLDKFKQLAQEKVNINFEKSALFLCLKNKHEKMAQYVASICETTSDQLDVAIQYENQEVIKILVSRQIKPSENLINKIAQIENKDVFYQLVSLYEIIPYSALHHINDCNQEAILYFAKESLLHPDENLKALMPYIIRKLIQENKEHDLTKNMIEKYQSYQKETKENHYYLFTATTILDFAQNSNIEIFKYVIEKGYFKLNEQNPDSFFNGIKNTNLVSYEFCQYLFAQVENKEIKKEIVQFALKNNHTSLMDKYITHPSEYVENYIKLYQSKNLNIKNHVEQSTLDILLDKIYENTPESLIEVEKFALSKGHKSIIEHLNVFKEYKKLNATFNEIENKIKPKRKI